MNLRVALIFPITGNERNWPEILTECQKTILPELKKLGADDIELKHCGGNYVYVANNETLEGEPKGRGICQIIKSTGAILDVIISCDGSGKIPYHYIPKIFQEIISDTSICCAMANRVENKSISAVRYLVERFEIFMLRQLHQCKREILDGQCGLWGFRSGKLTSPQRKEVKIELSADGYEVELDLLDEVLKYDLGFSFVDIELPKNDGRTSFSYEHNLKKLKFLIDKNHKLKDFLYYYLNEFQQSPEFVKLCDQSLRSEWEKYVNDVMAILKS